MIIYNRSAFGLNLIFRIRGSSVYRAVLPSLFSVAIYLVVHYVYIEDGGRQRESLGHPYAVGVLVSSITFLIVFRANQGYARYWEGAGSIHHMMSKFLDATVHSGVYHLQCDHYKTIKPPSYFDYPELNDLFLTRDRERGESYYKISTPSVVQEEEDDDNDDEEENEKKDHNQEGVFSDESLITSTSRRNLTYPLSPGKRGGGGVGGRSSAGRGRGLGGRGGPGRGMVRQISQSLSVNLNDMKMERQAHRAEREASKIKRKEQMQRARIKSINSVRTQSDDFDNSRRRLRSKNNSSEVGRRANSLPGIGESRPSNFEYSTADRDRSDNSASNDDLYDMMDSTDLSSIKFGEQPYPLVGRPRLDGNWSRFYKGDGKQVFRHDNHNPKGFASIDGGRMPPLFLQELAHLSSLLVAVALSTLRNDMEGFESPLSMYEPGKPWPEVDPDKDELVKKKGHLKNFCSTFLGIGRSPKEQTQYNAARPLPVIGGVSDAEIVFLQMARGPSAKTQLCWNWLSEFIIREHLAGSMGKVGPPIISRIIQFLGDGMIYYNHARKIMFIPFPFVHAQLTVLFTLVLVPAIPFLMDEYVDEVWLAITLTFLTVMCLVGIQEVARDLENPFRNVPNDLPLVTFQAQYNEALITMYSGWHPDQFWDGDKMLGRTKKSPQNQQQPITIPEEGNTSSSSSDNNTSAEIEQLKRQLAEQNKIIQQLLSKINNDDGDNENNDDVVGEEPAKDMQVEAPKTTSTSSDTENRMEREASFHPRHSTSGISEEGEEEEPPSRRIHHHQGGKEIVDTTSLMEVKSVDSSIRVDMAGDLHTIESDDDSSALLDDVIDDASTEGKKSDGNEQGSILDG